MFLLNIGVNTGECVPASPDSDEMTCEIYSWCPLEYDHLRLVIILILCVNNHVDILKLFLKYLWNRTKYPFLAEAVNFTVLIKNSIAFPKFKVRRLDK